MNEIESGVGQRIGGDIVTPHFEIGAARVGQEARIDVRHEHMTFGADTIGQPSTYGPAAASYFQAPPAPSDPGCQKMASGVRVMQGLETREPQRRFAFRCIVKNVARTFPARIVHEMNWLDDRDRRALPRAYAPTPEGISSADEPWKQSGGGPRS